MVRVISPDVLAAGVFGIAGTVVGLVGQRWIRTLGTVRCETRWYPEVTAVSESTPGGVEVQQRRLEVTFRNGKDVPVTVWDLEIVFYKGDKRIDADKRPVVDFADPSSLPRGGRPLEPVNLSSHVPVTCTLRVVPLDAQIVIAYDPEKLQALKEADRVEFVSHMVGASDIRKKLALWQDLTP